MIYTKKVLLAYIIYTITIAKMVPQKKKKKKKNFACQHIVTLSGRPFHPIFFNHTTRRLLSWWSLFEKKSAIFVAIIFSFKFRL